MESCNVLIECSRPKELKRLTQIVKNFKKENDPFRFNPFGAIGKEEAFDTILTNACQFDIVFTQINSQDFGDIVPIKVNTESDFEKRTGGILALQFAYQIKDMNPFVTIIMAADFDDFEDEKLFKMMMKASQVGVESFVPMPGDDTRMLEMLLDNLKSKVLYEHEIKKPIRQYFNPPECD